MRIFVVLCLMGVISSSHAENNNQVNCKFYTSNWNFLFAKRNLYTCRVENQTITQECTISSPSNMQVGGFAMANDKNVKFVPSDVASKFTTLLAFQIYNCSLEKIDGKTLKNLRKLKQASFSRNLIKTIDNDAFNDLYKLEWLALDNNILEYIGSRLFTSLESLKSLYLDGNRIEMLSPKSFCSLKNLELLQLKENNIQYLPEEIIMNLSNLKNISFNNNNIVTIHPKLFQKNAKIEYIWLSDNNIKFINSNTFQGLFELRLVNLMDNVCISNYFYNSSFDMMEETLEKNCMSNEFLLEKKVTAAHEKLKSLGETCTSTESNLEQKLKVAESKLSTEVLKSNQIETKLEQCMKDVKFDNEVEPKTTESTVLKILTVEK